MSKYEPGTVAVATVRGVAGVQVIRTCDHPDGGKGWVSATSVAANYTHLDHNVTDVSPLVVLDLRDSISKGWLPRWLRSNADYIGRESAGGDSSLSKDMRWIADQIEAQTKPPRIPEPGLWGVVEANVAGWTDGPRRFVNYGGSWIAKSLFGTKHVFWSDLIDPTLIREGVES